MIMGLMILTGGLWGPLSISQLGGQLKEVSEIHFPAIHNLGTMIQSQKTIQRVEYSLMIPETFSNEAEKGRLFKILEEAWERADKSWKSYETLPRTKEGEVLYNNLKPAWEVWRKSHQEFIQSIKEGKFKEAADLALGREKAAFAQAEKFLLDLSALNLKLGDQAKETGQTMEHWQKRMIGIGTAAGICVALFFGFFFSASISKPVQRIINHLSETCAQFVSTSEQIASSSHNLAAGTSSQAAAVEETSCVIEEVSSSAQRSTEMVQNLEKISNGISGMGYSAFEVFKQAKKATKEIKLASEETSKIIKTIGEIAFQTNLLALSASVEAAQSSEFKTGFSVVAQEVRNLAMRSTEAAKNTSAMIEETIKLTNHGDDLVRTSLGSFISYGELSIPIQSFSGKATEVAQKQVMGIEQINIALTEINRTAQNNAASAQESTSAAQEINAQAISMGKIVEELKQVVGGGKY